MKNKQKCLVQLFAFILLASVILLATPTIFAAAGDVDPGFIGAAEILPAETVFESVIQPDGKILIAGSFRSVGSVGRSGIARLNPDGTLDASFKPPDIRLSDNRGNGKIYAIALQGDGKIVIGGNFLKVGGFDRPGIGRLNSDGSLDNSFNLIHSFSDIPTVYDLKLQADGKILVGGFFRYFNAYVNLMRLGTTGSLDTLFFTGNSGDVVDVSDMLVQADGKIVYVGGGNSSPHVPAFKRINPDGNVDTTFASNTFGGLGIYRIARQTDGKLVIGGDFSSLNGFTQIKYIARFSADGVFDTSFNTNNPGPNGPVFAVNFLSNGKIIIGGTFTTYNSAAERSLALLNTDGTLDTSFVYTPFHEAVYDLDIVGSNNILVSRAAVDGFGISRNAALMKLDPSGLVDPAFSPNVGRNGTVYRTKVQPDGKILVVGKLNSANGLPRSVIARYNQDGTVDTSFNSNAFTTLPSNDFGPIDLQPDGKIIVGPYRLNPDGTLETTFQNVSAFDIKVQPDGKILFAGFQSLKRLNADGSPDGSFVVNTNSLIYNIKLLPGGKILIGGRFTQVNGVNRGYFARLNSDGTVDTTFNPPGGANQFVYNMDVQSDGKILIGGGFTAVNFDTSHKYLARLNPDGSLDTTFNAATNGNVYGLKVQSDGKILIGGNMSLIGGSPRNFFGRLNPDGSLDAAFNNGIGANDWVWELNQQADGKILIGGAFSQINGRSAVGFARLINSNTSFDFDGDGKSDVSVFRSSTNRWYEFLSGNSSVFETTFGVNGDIVAPADFDGDGKADLGIFRPSTGDWWYLSSVTNGQVNTHFGAMGDIPRPSDFDGDGKSDFIVFRPSNSAWYRLGSTGAVSVVPFGTSGDKPLAGDFDGDGKSDPAIYRPSTGTWWYQSSINNAQIATAFGISTDIPVPADYDGDGKTDLAVFRPSTGVWYILNSSTGSATIVGFGLAEDKPVAADYDGDGKADIAVFRPSTGIWYLLRSTAGFSALQFGLSTDTPVPNSFVP